MTNDFSRVRELFYRTLGEQAETADLKGLFSHAFRTFQERYLISSSGVSPKVFTYKAEKGTGAISLRLLSRYGQAELTALEIRGAAESAHLDAVLDGLSGEVELAYNGLGISKLPHSLQDKIQDRIQGKLGAVDETGSETGRVINQAHVVDMEQALFYLAPGPEEKVLKNVRFYLSQNNEPDTKALERYNEKCMGNEKGIGKFRALYVLADLIKLRSSYYRDDDPRLELITESCEVRRLQQGKQEKHNFVYSVAIANDQGMPVSLLPKVEHKFELIRSDFGILSFRRVRIQEGGAVSP